MQYIVHKNFSDTLKKLERPASSSLDLLGLVSDVFTAVQKEGDVALLNYIEKFENKKLNVNNLKVSAAEIAGAEKKLDKDLISAIQLAKKNIEKFHSAQIPSAIEVETMPGVVCVRKPEGIEKVGLYVPGGTAPLFSTVLMLAIPAKIASCKEVIMCTPCNEKGEVHPAILYTANLCGVSKIYKIGGSQAIAAMSIGTDTIPQVYKIFGPGNAYVTAAKQYASLLGTAIDMPAGPSEVMVVADEKANPSFIAADLLSQAEHGADSQVVLLSWSKEIIEKVQKEIETLTNKLSRKDFVEKSLQNSSVVYLKNEKEALEICNAYAPEHLILHLKNTNNFVKKVRNTGSVFIGDYTPESAGDYASGANHTLPTNGVAKQYSGVSTDSFMRYTTYQTISATGLKKLGPAIISMAEAEGLDAHALAVKIRLNYT